MMNENWHYEINSTSLELSNDTGYLTQAMNYACLSSFSMWLGYKLTIGKKVFSIYYNAFNYKVLFKQLNISIATIILLSIVGYLGKLILLNYGLYGALISEEITTKHPFLYSQARFIKDLSLLPLIVIGFYYFRTKSKKFKWMFPLFALIEIFFALITGSRSTIVITIVLLFFIFYWTTEVFKLRYVIFLIIPVIFAFTIGMEYKSFAFSTKNTNTNPIELYQNFMVYKSQISKSQQKRIYDNVYYNIVERMNYVSETAMAIRHKEKFGLHDSDPPFLEAIIYSPARAFLPSFILGKKNPRYGTWFREKVLKHNVGLGTTSIAMGAISFLYFSGGVIPIFIGFFFYGVFLKVSYLFLKQGILGFVLFLILLSILNTFSSIVSATITNLFRIFLIYPLIIFILFQKDFLNNFILLVFNLLKQIRKILTLNYLKQHK